MKARVKATGEIVEVEPTFVDGNKVYSWVTNNGYFHSSGSLDFETITQEKNDVKEKSLPKDEPDYWEKLKHQAAIAAMQGMMNNSFLVGEFKKDPNNGISDMSNIITKAAVIYATALVEKLKNETHFNK